MEFGYSGGLFSTFSLKSFDFDFFFINLCINLDTKTIIKRIFNEISIVKIWQFYGEKKIINAVYLFLYTLFGCVFYSS